MLTIVSVTMKKKKIAFSLTEITGTETNVNRRRPVSSRGTIADQVTFPIQTAPEIQFNQEGSRKANRMIIIVIISVLQEYLFKAYQVM